jgi:hypothetical protein
MKITKKELNSLIKEEIKRMDESKEKKTYSFPLNLPMKVELVIEDNTIEVKYIEHEEMEAKIKKFVLAEIQKVTGNKEWNQVGGNLLLKFPTYIKIK